MLRPRASSRSGQLECQVRTFFAAGAITMKWTLGKHRSYLATKGEVLDHFEHCLRVIKQRVRVDEYFGWAMESDEETDADVRIICRSSDGRPLVVEAKRLIKAYGFRIEPNDPLEISSTRVQSVSPDFCDMRGRKCAPATPRCGSSAAARPRWTPRITHH
jgi:hypothetical protein